MKHHETLATGLGFNDYGEVSSSDPEFVQGRSCTCTRATRPITAHDVLTGSGRKTADSLFHQMGNFENRLFSPRRAE